jgi:hypothetical protein
VKRAQREGEPKSFREKMTMEYVSEMQKHVKSKYGAENLQIFVYQTSYDETSLKIQSMLDETVRKI